VRTEQDAGVAAPDAVAGGADDRALRLHGAAFGAGPGPGAVVLPPARTFQEQWWRAVAHGAAGFYARAGADLAVLRREADACAAPAWSALAASTAASFLRQMGGHAQAAVFDGRALCRLASGPAGPHGGPPGDAAPLGALRAQACADAVTGMAADSLGRGDWRSSHRLLALLPRPGDPMTSHAGPDVGARARLRRH